MARGMKSDNDDNTGTDAPAEIDVTGPRSLMRVLGLFDVITLVPDGMSLDEAGNELIHVLLEGAGLDAQLQQIAQAAAGIRQLGR